MEAKQGGDRKCRIPIATSVVEKSAGMATEERRRTGLIPIPSDARASVALAMIAERAASRFACFRGSPIYDPAMSAFGAKRTFNPLPVNVRFGSLADAKKAPAEARA
jgi:hypothetical protein